MGCSAGMISIDLAKDLLHVHRNSYGIVVSMDNITLNWYFGNNISKLVSNSIFRMGGAAILLSNKRSEKRRRKYKLVHTVRTHKGAEDKCFQCVFQEEDEAGNMGVSLSKELMAVVGDAFVGRKLLKMRIKPYILDFKIAFENFYIHAGGRAVLDNLENNLQLSEWNIEPSRMTLYQFGNTSNNSLWYGLTYSEAKGRIRKGERTSQIAFRYGFMCKIVVWRAVRTINLSCEKNPWIQRIDEFPIDVPIVSTIQ